MKFHATDGWWAESVIEDDQVAIQVLHDDELMLTVAADDLPEVELGEHPVYSLIDQVRAST